MTRIFLAAGPEVWQHHTALPILAAGGTRITPFPFSQLLLVMKMGTFPSQFSAGTAPSRADRTGCFFLFPPAVTDLGTF